MYQDSPIILESTPKSMCSLIFNSFTPLPAGRQVTPKGEFVENQKIIKVSFSGFQPAGWQVGVLDFSEWTQD